MPPKRQRSTRSSAKKAAAEEPEPPDTEDAKPNVEELPIETEPSVQIPSAEPDTTSTLTATAATGVSASPAPSPNPADGRKTGPATQRGKKLLSKPKFSGRRSQSKLQEIQSAEDQRKKAEVEAKATAEASSARRDGKRRDDGQSRGRGGGMSGRGRGGYMGERERKDETVASGPFSAGQVNKESKRGRKRYGGSDSRSSITSRESRGRTTTSPAARPKTTVNDGQVVKQEGVTSTTQKAIADSDGDVSMDEHPQPKVEDGGYISSDEDEEERAGGRVNVEDLGIIDLTYSDPFAPVRVTRVAHKERALGINADGATDQEGVITIDANDTTNAGTSEKRKAKQKAKDVEITSEQKRFQATYSDSDSDAEPQRSIKIDPEGDPEPLLVASSNAAPRVPSSSPDARRRTKEKAKVSINEGIDYQNPDELEEWEQHQRDLKVLRNELGVAGVDKDGDATMANSQVTDRRAQKVYLFQFPPVLPDLHPIVVKPDPETIVDEANGMQIDEPITIADDESKPKTRVRPSLPAGAVGKLKVHASGRVTLDWGGTSLCLGMGTEASFLQDILVANLPDAKDGDGEVQHGTATSMGQVKGKFVVTPDWDEILRKKS